MSDKKKAQDPAKRRRMLGIIGVVFAVAAIIGVVWMLLASGFEETDNATIEGHVNPVSARVSGKVTKVLVDDNQLVKQGQLLAVIDASDYELALQEAEANLKATEEKANTALKNIGLSQKQTSSELLRAQGQLQSSRALVTQSRAGVTESQAALKAARQGLDQQEAAFQKAQLDYQRYSAVDPNAISARQLDQIKADYQIATAQRDAAKEAVRQAQARVTQARAGVSNSGAQVTQSQGNYQSAQAQVMNVDIAKTNYAQAKADIDRAKADLNRAKLNLGYTHIYAPTDGRIGRKSLEVGQQVQMGEPLLAIVQPQLWVIANFKETQLRKMQIGQPVEVHVDAFPDRDFEGKVSSFSPATGAVFALLPPENATGNFTKIVQRVPVKILLSEKSIKAYRDRLAPGLSVVAKVDVR